MATQTASREPAASSEQTEVIRVLLPSPIGPLGAEFRGRKVTRLVIAPSRTERKLFLSLKEAGRSSRSTDQEEGNGEFLDEALGRVSEYFVGARMDPGIEYELDEAQHDPFALLVLAETAKIPYGETRTYHKLAAAAGRPESYRLVRSVLMSNPLPVLVPCHRVIPAKGGAGTYVGGTRRKDWLLRLEARGLQTG